MGKMAALVALSPRYTTMLDDNVALLAVTLHGVGGIKAIPAC